MLYSFMKKSLLFCALASSVSFASAFNVDGFSIKQNFDSYSVSCSSYTLTFYDAIESTDIEIHFYETNHNPNRIFFKIYSYEKNLSGSEYLDRIIEGNHLNLDIKRESKDQASFPSQDKLDMEKFLRSLFLKKFHMTLY